MFPVPLLINYSKKMLNDSFDGNEGFHLEGGLKDAKYAPLPPLISPAPN